MPLAYRIVPVTPYQQNCTIFWNPDTKKGGIVDPGGDLENLKSLMAEEGVEIEKILCTHGHLDHVGGVATLAKELDVPIIGPHKEDLFWIEQLPSQAEFMNFPPCEKFESDQWLEHGDEVEVAGAIFQVLHCPGHTPGHVVFYQPDDKIALVGDVLFMGSIGRTDFPRGNHEELVRSIKTHLWPLGDEVQFVPGHGPTSTIGHERKTNPFVADENFG
ncbi:MAG: MBL fold metallo-hydrolase [Parvibaculales bacterium]